MLKFLPIGEEGNEQQPKYLPVQSIATPMKYPDD
jgi:hypothetical protein